MTNAALRTACAVAIVFLGLTAATRAATTKSSTSAAPNVHVPTPAKPLASADGIVDMGKLEMVTARYPDGKIKIEREVGQDAAGNYFNQGSFKMYSPSGDVVKAGEYLNGRQIGKWTQKLVKDDGYLFSLAQDGELTGPYTSEATFQDGRLHGAWLIKDARGQSLIQWTFENGVPAGTWTWWYANGQKRLEATYSNGALTGDVIEWDRDGKIINKNTYVDGKCVVKSVKWYTLGQKHFEGNYLHATGMPDATYDWWNSKIVTATIPADVPDQQHGIWTEWYPGGNKKTEGEYDHGVAIGKFTWWYENGQKQAEGDYENGQKSGVWTTWHANGLKETQAEYKVGKLVSKLMTWSANGKLIESREVSEQSAPPATHQYYSPRTSQRSGFSR